MKTRVFFGLMFFFFFQFTIAQKLKIAKDFDGADNGFVTFSDFNSDDSKSIIFQNKMVTTAQVENFGSCFVVIDGRSEEILKYSNGNLNINKTPSANTFFTISGNRLYFKGMAGVHFSDDINTSFETLNNSTSFGQLFALSQNQILLSADVANTTGRELYISTFDGVNHTTTLVSDINPGAANSTPQDFTAVATQNSVVFSAIADGIGRMMYEYSSSNTPSVSPVLLNGDPILEPLEFTQSPSDGNIIYFTARDSNSTNRVLYKYNFITKAINKYDFQISNPSPTRLFTFSKNISGTDKHYLLMTSDYGTIDRELVVLDIDADTITPYELNTSATINNGDSIPQLFTVFNGAVYFKAVQGNSFNSSFFKFDGTNVSVAATYSSAGNVADDMIVYNNELYFLQSFLNLLGKIDTSDNIIVYSSSGSNFGSGVNGPENFLKPLDRRLYLVIEKTSSGHKELGVFAENFETRTIAAAGDVSIKSWSDAANWDNGLPDRDFVANLGSAKVEITGNEIAGGLIVSSPVNELFIRTTGTLTVKGDINSSGSPAGSIRIGGNNSSSGSLIYEGVFVTGSQPITYRRDFSTNWHLISNPTFTETIEGILPSLATSSTVANRKGLAFYNNSFSGSGGGGSGNKNQNNTTGWSYYNANDTGTFELSRGYALKKAPTTTTIDFTGFPFSDDETIPLSDGSDNNWNLIGNPFTSSIAVNNGTNSTKNLLSRNSAELDPNFQALYFWDGTKNSGAGGYEIINNTSPASYVLPGQGFFVHAKGGGGTFYFDDDMQVHAPANAKYLKSQNKTQNNGTPEVSLLVTNGALTKSTQIKYFNNSTRGLDAGYDAGAIDISGGNGNETSFKVYSNLIDNNQGIAMGLQCLPKDYENLVIPIGVNASANTELTFTVNSANLPIGVDVYLEDKVTGNITKFDNANTTYKVTPTNNLSGTGRFYLHTSANNVLSTASFSELSSVSIYQKDRVLNISGLVTVSEANVTIYNLLGQQLLQKSADTKNTNMSIDLSNNIKTGVYIVSIKSGSDRISKKIILK